jgi:excisionase family DNA binding protein
MKCKCGAEIPPKAKFCSECGGKAPEPKPILEAKPPQFSSVQYIPKLSFSTVEAADVIGVSDRMIRNLAYQGELDYVQLGRRIVIRKEALQKLLERHEVIGQVPDLQRKVAK